MTFFQMRWFFQWRTMITSRAYVFGRRRLCGDADRPVAGAAGIRGPPPVVSDESRRAYPKGDGAGEEGRRSRHGATGRVGARPVAPGGGRGGARRGGGRPPGPWGGGVARGRGRTLGEPGGGVPAWAGRRDHAPPVSAPVPPPSQGSLPCAMLWG